jgi:signal transduction histidine kinase
MAEPVDTTALVALLGMDADLLSRWLSLLTCSAEPDALARRIEAIPAATLRDLSLAQAIAVLAVPGNARLDFHRWRATLIASLLGEALAADTVDPAAMRWRLLLAVSGAQVPHDLRLVELQQFRGTRRDLLEDASLEHRLLAVVETFDPADPSAAQDIARQLLNIDGEFYRTAVTRAERMAAEWLDRFGLAHDRDSDGFERVWLRLQMGVLEPLLAGAAANGGLLSAHELISRRLLGRVPALFLCDSASDRLVRLDGEGPEIARSSQSSVIARCVRLAERSELIDRLDQAVADRQVLRHLGTEEAICLPVLDRDGKAIGALVFGVDEEGFQDTAMAIYSAALARHLTPVDRETGPASDLDQYRQLEEKRLRELVHEANNPLSVVNNYLHILESRLSHEPEVVDQLRLIGAELRRAGGIIAQARELPPLEEDRQEAQVAFGDFDLNELARQLVQLHRGLADDNRVNLGESLAPEPLIVRSDRQRLIQIVNNLLRNAIEAATDTSVTVSTVSGIFREGREGVLVDVADTGPGLPRSVAERLAEPKQSTKGGDHAGLGLHIVYRLVSEIGGSIDVRTAAGRGTAFSIFLPLRP